jgi:hypothetical protein
MTAEGELEFVSNQNLEYFGTTLEELKSRWRRKAAATCA